MDEPRYSDNGDAPMPAPAWKPDMRQPGGEGVPSDDRRDGAADEAEAPDGKATGGAASVTPREPFPNPLANRNTQGPRVAGKTPRPTENPGE